MFLKRRNNRLILKYISVSVFALPLKLAFRARGQRSFFMDKIITATELEKYISENRSGRKIVFTNGCFDLIHSGHIRLLQFAASCGDVLIVGINSDSSVKRLKGDKRPIVPENERAEVLAALACVDFVTVFSEDTPCSMIERIRPDIHVKGGDYDMDKIPEAAVIRSYGGRMERFSFVEGHSSTNIIDRILNAYGSTERSV